MRFVQFRLLKDMIKATRIGLQKKSGGIVDLSDVLPNCHSIVEALGKLGGNGLIKIAQTNLANKETSCSKVQLLAPITSPDKIFCIGLNYRDTCKELGFAPPDEPLVFSKFSNSITGPFDKIKNPDISKEVFWEAELAVVLGKKGKNIEASEAKDYVFGYTVANDLTALDWHKKNGGQWLLGKTMDGFCPIGPNILTADKIPDPHNLKISCSVNGQIKQTSNTNQLIHGVFDCISFLSKFCTLLPGDIILTGTPPGSGGFAKPPQFLQEGDVVECEIEQLGKIRNQIE
ncbi:fumarylacetoacetate hydrolase domain-containing protein 2-like isoform X1 [Daphnia pulicaria]|uniref:fumarylacetoacetate hydrolase domain-containing protein 2-like isoform X1 n=2 Tax=Daphnia pulicaria TaxID=35523 RepID=UPI001EECCF2B|nr:fumarylacetoacetate hydrolase domain-containing protein 2-like isoform X1 [Daphnia pulicaria]